MISMKTSQGTEISYVGCVLGLYEQNGYNDSDFFAKVWDEETQSIKHIEYATTRAYTLDNYAKVDATEEVLKKVRAYRFEGLIESILYNSKIDSDKVVKDKVVRVVKGRKVPLGVEGTVFYTKEEKYSQSRWAVTELKIGIKDAEGNVYWTYAKNVEVVNPEQYIKTPRQAKLEAVKIFKAQRR